MRGSFRHWRADRDGNITLEFALILPILLLLSVGVMEAGLMLITDASMELAIRAASRFGITGSPGTTGTNASDRNTLITNKIEAVVGRWKGSDGTLTVETRAYTTFGDIGHPEPYVDANSNEQFDSSETFTDVNGNGRYDDGKGTPGAGLPGEMVIYTVTLTRPGFTGVLNLIGISNLTFVRKMAVENE